MTVQDYLKQYNNHKRRMNCYLEEYEHEADVIMEIQNNLNVIPTKQRRKAEENLDKCVMFCNGLKDRAKESANMMDEIQAMIESIPGLEGEILKLRYIDGLIWEDICESVNYSWRGVFHKHDKALQMVDEKLKAER